MELECILFLSFCTKDPLLTRADSQIRKCKINEHTHVSLIHTPLKTCNTSECKKVETFEHHLYAIELLILGLRLCQ